MNDSIWFKTYFHYNNEIIRPKTQLVLQEVAERNSLSMSEMSLFNMLVQNSDFKPLEIEDFKIKYPFSKDGFVESSYNLLVEKGVMCKRSVGYALTKEGKRLLNNLELEYNKQLSHPINDSILTVFKKVSENSLRKDFSGINRSVENRKHSILRFEDSNNKFLQLMTAMGDLVALRNDQAHYRYEFILDSIPEHYGRLTHPMMELLGSVYDHGNLDVDRFLARSTWGHSNEETLKFVQDLLEMGLLNKNDSVITLSEKGNELEKRTSIIYEYKFYEPWLFIDKSIYRSLERISLK
ncbi:MAG: hypothetical protein WBG90_22025 [Saonia sp.]